MVECTPTSKAQEAQRPILSADEASACGPGEGSQGQGPTGH